MKLYCLGASNPVAVRLISAVQKVDGSMEMAGFLDNDPDKKGKCFPRLSRFGRARSRCPSCRPRGGLRQPDHPRRDHAHNRRLNKQEVADNIGNDPDFRRRSIDWLNKSAELRYSYNFAALGRPVIQYPQDIVAMQEVIWQVRPDLIIETGIAHGGSLIGSAATLALLDMTNAIEQGVNLDPRASSRKVIGIDIRPHNRKAIESHPMSSRIPDVSGIEHRRRHRRPGSRYREILRKSSGVPRFQSYA